MKNFYRVLGVSRSATKEEIKKAYRKKAMIYHPDQSSSSSSLQFLLLQEAYQTLSNPIKKEKYDIDYDILYPISYFEKRKKGAEELLQNLQNTILKCSNENFTHNNNENLISSLYFYTSNDVVELFIDIENESLVEEYKELLIKSTNCRIISTDVEYFKQILSALSLFSKAQNDNQSMVDDILLKIKKAKKRRRADKILPYLIILSSFLLLTLIMFLSSKQ